MDILQDLLQLNGIFSHSKFVKRLCQTSYVRYYRLTSHNELSGLICFLLKKRFHQRFAYLIERRKYLWQAFKQSPPWSQLRQYKYPNAVQQLASFMRYLFHTWQKMQREHLHETLPNLWLSMVWVQILHHMH